MLPNRDGRPNTSTGDATYINFQALVLVTWGVGSPRLQLAISTRTFGARPDPGLVIDGLLRLEAPAVAVHAGLPRGLLAVLVEALGRERTRLPVLAVSNYAPAPEMARNASAVDALSLCSPDRDERAHAIAAAAETLRVAADLGAPVVVLALGEATATDWPALARRLLRGDPLPERLLSERRQASERVLDGARFALDRLLEQAADLGVTLALPNRARFYQAPSTLELAALRADFAGAPLRPWLDAGAGHTAWAAGGFEPGEWLDLHGPAAAGVSVADACGPLRGLPPGLGELGYRALAKRLAQDRELIAVMNTNDGFTDDELRAGMAQVRALAGAGT